MGMGTNAVTGGLGGVVGIVLLLIAFYLVPGRQRFVFLGLWLVPVFMFNALGWMIGVYFWGMLGFWVSLFLTEPIATRLGLASRPRGTGSDSNEHTPETGAPSARPSSAALQPAQPLPQGMQPCPTRTRDAKPIGPGEAAADAGWAARRRALLTDPKISDTERVAQLAALMAQRRRARSTSLNVAARPDASPPAPSTSQLTCYACRAAIALADTRCPTCFALLP